MISENFIKNNLKLVSSELKKNFYYLNKTIFKFLFVKKKNILNILNILNKTNKINFKKNIILERFFIKKISKIYKNFFIKINNKIKNFLSNIPNVKHKEIKFKNKIIKIYWKHKNYSKIITNYKNLIKNLGVNLKLGVNLTNKKTTVIYNNALYLYKALIKYILNLHITEHNYKEIKIPYIINYKSIINSGQLPKFIKNIFIIDKNKYLIPTAEVIIVNSINNKNIKQNLLPIKLFSITECFRKEKKSYGKKNKGLIRQNQFEKIELINFTDQKNSYNNLKELVKIVEKILKNLKLNYRILQLSYIETGFTASKTFDIEVWMPELKNFCEISSCSNTEKFQSYNTNLKYFSQKKNYKFIHILNGSGIPLGRTLLAIIENYYFNKNYIIIPKILRKYMNNKHLLKIQ